MGWFDRLIGKRDEETLPLYNAIVGRAREPHWYVDGAVPDTVDGRFDMIAAVLGMVLLRLESDPSSAAPAAQLTERFVDDMDGQLRELGVGDIVVGKHIGKMMAMLGGRLGAYRDGIAGDRLGDALVRNLYRGVSPGPEPLEHTRAALIALHDRLSATAVEAIINGELP